MSQLRPLPPVVRLSLISTNQDHTIHGLDYGRKQVDPQRGDRSAETKRTNLCLVGGASSVTAYDLVRDLRGSHRVIAIQGDTTTGRTGGDKVKFRTTIVWLENETKDANPSPQDTGVIEEMMSAVEAFFFPSGAGTKMVVFDGVYVYLNDGNMTVNMVRSAEPPVAGEPVFHLCFRPGNLYRPFPLYLDEEKAYSTRVTDRVTLLAAHLWEQVDIRCYREIKACNKADWEVDDDSVEDIIGPMESELTSIAAACQDKQFQAYKVTQEEAARAASLIDLEAAFRHALARWQVVEAARVAKAVAK